MPILSFHKSNIRAAVATDVEHARSSVVVAEWSRINPHAIWVRPPGAWSGPDISAVRPAEEHAHVHAGHVAPAAALKPRGGERGAPVRALFVCRGCGDSAEGPVATPTVVMASG